MKTCLIFALLSASLTTFAKGRYSDESFIICDVDIRKIAQVRDQGYLDIAPDSKDPFIHCARPSQLFEVMNKYFAGTTQLILVTHPDKIGSILKYENNYPHLYGRLWLDDVIYSTIKTPNADGTYSLPEEFSARRFSLDDHRH